MPNRAYLKPAYFALFLLVTVLLASNHAWSAVPHISAGGTHSMLLKSDGSLWAAGSNQSGQLGDGSLVNRPDPVQIAGGPWKAVSAGRNHTLAIKSDGTLWSWGSNTFGQLGLPKVGTPPNDTFAADRLIPTQIGTDTTWTAVVAAGFSSLALKADGSLWVWGDNSTGQLGDGTLTARAEPFQLPAPLDPLNVPSSGRYIHIASSGEHTLAIQADGTLWATGFNLHGQLGNGSTISSTVLVKIVSGSRWTAVAAGGLHSLAIQSDGSLWSWGRNLAGQLGNEAAIPGADVTTPARISAASGNDWIAISASELHSLAIKRNGTVWSWGGNVSGQLGSGNTADRSIPTALTVPAAISKDMISVSAGDNHSLALRGDGQIFAWGSNASGQFGSNTLVSSTSAVAGSATSSGWTDTRPGRLFTLATRGNGTLWGWGSNTSGQLGNGSLLSTSTPQQIGAATIWRTASGGTNHVLALAADGTLWSWGSDATGQLGNGVTTGTITTPQKLLVSALVDPQLSDSDWAVISSGSGHSVAVKADGSLWSWGDNTSGQLGMFDPLATSITTIPGRVTVANGVPAGFNNGWIDAAAGGSHTLALQSDGTLWGWGNNFNGEIGQDPQTGTFFFTPRQIFFDPVPAGADPFFNSSWVRVSAGSNHSVGLQADGSVWVWGVNNLDQLGNNATGVSSFRPVKTSLPAAAVRIAAGQSHSHAQLVDGNVWGWGRNDNGQLGVNSSTTPTTPRQVTVTSPASLANDWAAIGAGSLHSVLLKQDGTLWSSGANSSGQTGLGTPATVLIPTRLPEPRAVISPASLNFGNTYLGTVTTVNRTVTITNSGTAPLQAAIASSDPALFAVSPASCGSIAPAGICAITVTFTPTAPLGLKTAQLTVTSTDSLTPVTVIPVSAQVFNPIEISASATAGGTISPAGQVPVAAGASQTFIFTPDPGFRLQDVVVDGLSQGAVGSYTFGNVAVPHTIQAVFVPGVTVTVTVSAGQGGTISPNNTVVLNQGDNKTFTITPDFGFAISNVVVTEMVEDRDQNGNGLGTFSPVTSNLGAVTSFTFFNVRVSGSSISATFAATSIRTWTWRNPLPHGLTIRHSEYDGSSTYAAVGDFGIIMTSTNGSDWTVRQSGTMNLNGIAYGAGRFVAVGNGGRILRSSTGAADGYATWNEVSSGTPANLNGIVHNGTVFVAVGNSQISENFPFVPRMTILTSPDGLVWSDHSPLLPINEFLDLRDVAAGNGTLVAAGQGGILYTSLDDGVTWNRVPDDLDNRGSAINSISFGANTFVAVGDFAQVSLSFDSGLTWIPVSIPGTFADLKGVSYGTGGLFTAVGSDGSILTSENLGANWSIQDSGIPGDGTGATLLTVTATSSGLLAAGQYGSLLTSPDGISWTDRRRSVTDLTLRSVSRGNGVFVAVGGAAVTAGAPAAAAIVRSADNGQTWTAASIPGSSQNLTSVAYGSGLFVAVGKSAYNFANPTATATILTSPDGITWTQRASGSFLGLNAVAFVNNRFIAVGDYNPLGNDKPEGAALLTSTNGITWTFSQIITQNGFPLHGIGFNGSTYILVGELGSLLTSTNGTTWADRGDDPIINGYDLSSIAFGAGQFRAVGLTTEVGVGPRAFVSSNGTAWTTESLPLPTVLNNRVQGIAFFNNQFVAVGNDNFILSRDMATPNSRWLVNTGSDFINSSLNGISVGNGAFVAVGDRGTILQSLPQVTGLPEISVSPEHLAFGSLTAGFSTTRSITVVNNGPGALNISSVSPPNGAFSIGQDLCSGRTLTTGQSCTVEVIFWPQGNGGFDSSLNILSNDPDSPLITVPMEGEAVAPAGNLVRLTVGTPPDHPSIRTAYAAAAQSDEIRARTAQFGEIAIFNQGKTVTLSGGWNSDFTAPSAVGSVSAIQGRLTISAGTVRVRDIRIRP